MPPSDGHSSVQSYYGTLESRIGYRFILGGTRHFGFYNPGTYWPFPVTTALRAMEDKLVAVLGEQPGREVLDAGCGSGHVAIHLAKNGFYVQGIDLVKNHVKEAQHNIISQNLEARVSVTEGDYHSLDGFDDASFDAAYTMETFVHATRPEVAAAEFFRVIRPEGLLVMFEYDHIDFKSVPSDVSKSWAYINKLAAMPGNSMFEEGVLERIIQGAGFEVLAVQDLSENVLPMLRLFYILAFIPYFFVMILGLKHKFINIVVGYEGYIYRDSVRYTMVTARKPGIDEGTVPKLNTQGRRT